MLERRTFPKCNPVNDLMSDKFVSPPSLLLPHHPTRDPEADVVALERDRTGIVRHRRAMERPRPPRAAAHHRVALFASVLVAATLGALFTYVAQHVVQTPRVRLQLHHRVPAAPLAFVFGVGRVGDVEPPVF